MRSVRSYGHILKRALYLGMLVPLLSGCLLMSGPRESADRATDGGNVRVDFISAEGTETRHVQAADGPTKLALIVSAQVERGQLRIVMLNPQGAQVLVLEGTPEQHVAQVVVPTDDKGNLTYRIQATGAHHGGFEILYQPAE
ncbi:MAG: hypothetical protein H0X37_22495 [Herpetosiphonaceae bacterium]|nr:hypothetical protein [Herpetosiphonaceae bacterium]